MARLRFRQIITTMAAVMVGVISLASSAAAAAGDDYIEDNGSYGPNYFAELQDAEFKNNRVWVWGVGGLDILNVDNTTNVYSVGRFQPAGHPYERYYRGSVGASHAYCGAREDLLDIIDISSENFPVLVATHGQSGMSYEGSAVSGNVLVACRHADGVEFIDITTPASPVTLSEVLSLENAWDAAVLGSIAYVADGAGGLAVLDMSDPAVPVHVRSVATTGNALDVSVVAGLLVVACGSAGVDIFTLSDPVDPVYESTYDSPGLAVATELEGTTLSLADWKGVDVVDLSIPSLPVRIGREDTPVRAMGLAVDGARLYVTDWSGVRVYDVGPTTRGDVQVSVDQLRFEHGPAGATDQKTFTISNTGGGLLRIAGVSVFNTAYTIDIPGPFDLLSGEEQLITIDYTSSGETYDGTFLRIDSDDRDESSVTFPLASGDNSYQLDPGDQAPDFYLDDLGGAKHSLARYRGRVVVMAFFANW